MDPLSALGLASAILQILDFSSKLISGATEVYSSASGMTAEFEDSDRAVESLKGLTRRLDIRTTGAPLSNEEHSLLQVKDGCEALSRDVQAIINSTKIQNTGSKRASVVASWTVMRRRGKLKALEDRLNRYRAQAQEYLLATMSDDLSNTNKFLGALTQEQAQYAQTTRSEIHQMNKDITSAIREAQAKESKYSSDRSPESFVLLSRIQESLVKLVKATQAVTREDTILQRLWFTELGSRQRTVEMPHEQTFRWLLYDPRLNDSSSENSQGEDQPTEPATIDASSFGRGSCSGQSEGSKDDQDVASFRTAPDAEDHDVPDVSDYVEADSGSSIGEHSLAHGIAIRSEQSRWIGRQQSRWRKQKRESFLYWLRSGDGTFYCSGKAGSGKSTLMKFLARDKQTHDALSFWSQTHGKTLILASFFFWSSGSPLQRSLEGLYRAILWEVLRQCPGLIHVVFPAAWSSAGVGKPPMALESFAMDELETAMDLLFCDKQISSSHRLCLFIDGLDEYEGDYWKFAKAITRWASSSKDVKFCVSSRPYNAFLRHFARDDMKHLKLHELTRGDMYSFVADQFRQDERYTAIEDDIREFDFLEAIVDRSDDVFLWVRLVTVELLSGMGDSCSIAQLKKRLESIPSGLKSMFQRMLASIHQTEQQRAAQMFLTMTHDAWNDKVSTIVFVQAFLDELADDPGLAVPLLSGDIGPYLSPADCIKKCHMAGPRAVARCKGLIEVTHTDRKLPLSHRFSFVHRTVGDFFNDIAIQSSLKSTAGDFCHHRSFAHAVLACFKFIDPNEFLQCPQYEPDRRPCPTPTTSTASRSSLYDPGFARVDPFGLMFPFLEIIRNAESDGIPSMAMEVDALISLMRQTAEQDDHRGHASHFPRPVFGLNDMTGWHWGPIPTRNLQSAVVSFSISFDGLTETAFELISTHPDLLVLSPGQHHVFLSAALEDLYDAFCFGEDISRTRVLIGRASSSINADCSDICNISPKLDKWNQTTRTLGLHFSTWGAFLLALSQLMRHGKPTSPSNLAGISTLLELFLQHGADPRVIFMGYSFPTSTDDSAQMDPTGPLYSDLLGMMIFWRLIPTDATRDILNAARQKQRRGWFHRSLSGFPYIGLQTRDPCEKMSPFDEKTGGDFVPLSITPHDNLASVSSEILQELVKYISGHGSRNVDFRFYV